MPLPRFGHWIGGRETAPAGGRTITTDMPHTGAVWAEVARGDAADVAAAVAAAEAALPAWSGLSASERGRRLLQLADLVVRDAESLAELEVRDNGKLFAEMHGQTRYIAEWFRYFAGLADKLEGAVIPTDKPDMFNFTRHEPLGVVGMITPWNSPLLLLTWKLAPALAAGNVAVVKPSEFTSVSTLTFARLFDEAGFPPGVVNVVTGLGTEAGAALVDHPGVAKIAFTGSDAVGRVIYERAARGLKRVSLELGGKSPNIVFEDADMDAAISGVIAGIFAATGQTCIAGSRLLLHRSIHDAFLERLVEVARRARIGDPMLPDTDVGAVATEPQYRKILDYIAIARAEGARCVLGGAAWRRADAPEGRFVEPTIFADVRNDMRIAQEEVFGPVLAVIPFEDEADAIRIANATRFGLGAGVWTQDIGRALRVSAEIRSGTVWVNTYRTLSYTSPFGGTKDSGIGREGGIESIRDYVQTKSVWISTRPHRGSPFVMR
jgi:aldehyde dehydrogenase (NAD+)